MELDFHANPAILGDLVDEMAVGIFTVNAEGHFVAWSGGAERITGYSRAEVLGKPCELLEGNNCKGFARLTEMLQSPPPGPSGICNQECKLMAKDGHELYIHGNFRLIQAEDGRVLGAVGTFSDLTSFMLANERIRVLEKQASAMQSFEKMVGQGPAMREVFRRIQLAADSDVTVLITGESGTGKELAAAAIHARSRRKEKPLLAVNCSAIPDALLESELFGHVRGAFTGAVSDKLGLFEAADGGTLFLDEIGDVSSAIQVKLLRTLQEHEIRRVGDSRNRKVDVRVVTATNKDLRQLVAENEVREDFFYRIHVFEIRMPPLRERTEDIPLLVDHFIRQLCHPQGRATEGITRDALQLLMDYSWPGNIRQLRNAIEHACVTVSGPQITYLDLPLELRGPHALNLPKIEQKLSDKDRAERQRIVEALRTTQCNRTEAAKLLGYSRVTLWKKITRYAIQLPCH